MPPRSPSSPDEPVGLIGLGLIGSALVVRLQAAGRGIVGWDIAKERLEAAQGTGAAPAGAADEVFRRCRCVLLSLPSHREVADVIEAAGPALAEGHTIVDTTTGEPAHSEELARTLAARGIAYLDATISGSSAQLRAGDVTLMVGGEPGAFAACSALFACLGRRTFHTGPAGTGARMKLVTNLVLGLNRAALAEGIEFARSLGLDLGLTLEVMRESAAYSRIMDTKGERMIHGRFSPDARLSQHLKDVRLIVEAGRRAGLPMPLSATHQEILEAAEAAGWGEFDNSAIIKALAPRPNGTTP